MNMNVTFVKVMLDGRFAGFDECNILVAYLTLLSAWRLSEAHQPPPTNTRRHAHDGRGEGEPTFSTYPFGNGHSSLQGSGSGVTSGNLKDLDGSGTHKDAAR